MKQGHILNKIVMLTLLGAILTYLGASVWQNLTGRMTTVYSYSYTLDDEAEATGLLVREEYVLPARSALADVLPAEGEKVAVNETVAYLYQDAAALERRQTIRKLGLELEQLTKTAASAGDLSDSARLTDEIMTGLTQLRAAVSSRDFTRLEDETLKLKSLVYQRDYTYESGGDAAGLQAKIAELSSRRESLIAAAGQDTSVVRTDKAGVFSGVVDGYESLLTPGNVFSLTPSELDSLAANPPAGETGAVGKLITHMRWYFVCSVSEEQSKRLTKGWQVKVRFSRDWSGEVSMRVEQVGQSENGRVPIVFSSTHYLADITLLRRQTVDIVYSSVTGIRVPKNALLQDEEGRWGVYAVVGAQAEFKSVTIVGDDGDYYLVQPLTPATDLDKESAKKALRPGDEIILRADGLFDGKVVRS
jgi:putative membrane fusion protein